jgi:hypothetical protein
LADVPRISFTKSDAAVDNKVADIAFFGGSAQIRFRNDAASSSRLAYAVTGTFSSVSSHTFYTGADVASATINSSGNLLVGGTTDITGSGGLKVFGTTASTSTTTGALQVAGGVGVAGALFVGGNLTVLGTSSRFQNTLALRAPGNTCQLDFQNSSGTVIQSIKYNDPDGSLTIGGSSAVNVPIFFNSATSVERARFTTTGNLLIGGTTDITGSGGLKVFGTTASTSTTTGALQVAGGVGIGGNLHIGGTTIGLVHNTTISGGGGVGPLKMECTADAGSTVISAGTSSGYVSQVVVNARSNASPGIRFSTRNTERMVIADATGDATFNGAIAIGNTVNTVTATLPNRTITMVIGGTTYYIHAKTTND